MNKKDECFKIYNSIKSKFNEQKVYRTFEDFFGEDGFENLLQHIGNVHQHKYDLWIFQELHKDPDFLLEDINRMNEALALYKNNIDKIENKNLFDYSFDELETVVMPLKIKETKNKLKTLKDVIIEKETIHIFENETGKAVIPLTYRSAQFWGLGTKWCTSAKSDVQYAHYTKRGPLMIVLTNDNDYNNKQIKYQYHFGKSVTERRNHNDKKITETELYFSNKKHLRLISECLKIMCSSSFLGRNHSDFTNLYGIYVDMSWDIQEKDKFIYTEFFLDSVINFGINPESVFCKKIYSNKNENEIITDLSKIILSKTNCEASYKKFAINFLIENNDFDERILSENNIRYIEEKTYSKMISKNIIDCLLLQKEINFSNFLVRYDFMKDEVVDNIIQYLIKEDMYTLMEMGEHLSYKILSSEFLFEKYYQEVFFRSLSWGEKNYKNFFSENDNMNVTSEIEFKNMKKLKEYILSLKNSALRYSLAYKIIENYPDKAKDIISEKTYNELMKTFRKDNTNFWIGKEYPVETETNVDKKKITNFLSTINPDEINFMRKLLLNNVSTHIKQNRFAPVNFDDDDDDDEFENFETRVRRMRRNESMNTEREIARMYFDDDFGTLPRARERIVNFDNGHEIDNDLCDNMQNLLNQERTNR